MFTSRSASSTERLSASSRRSFWSRTTSADKLRSTILDAAAPNACDSSNLMCPLPQQKEILGARWYASGGQGVPCPPGGPTPTRYRNEGLFAPYIMQKIQPAARKGNWYFNQFLGPGFLATVCRGGPLRPPVPVTGAKLIRINSLRDAWYLPLLPCGPRGQPAEEVVQLRAQNRLHHVIVKSSA